MLLRREGSSPQPGAALEAASAGWGSRACGCAVGINSSSTTGGKAKCWWPSLSACAPHLHPAAVLPSPTTEASFQPPKEDFRFITWVVGLVSPPHYPLQLQWVKQCFLNKNQPSESFSLMFSRGCCNWSSKISVINWLLPCSDIPYETLKVRIKNKMAGKHSSFKFTGTKPWQIRHLWGKGMYLGSMKLPEYWCFLSRCL